MNDKDVKLIKAIIGEAKLLVSELPHGLWLLALIIFISTETFLEMVSFSMPFHSMEEK